MSNNRMRILRLNTDSLIPARVGPDTDSRKQFIISLISSVEFLRCAEPVDEGAFATRAFGMREQVQSLEASGLGEVCVVGVRLEAFACVGGVL